MRLDPTDSETSRKTLNLNFYSGLLNRYSRGYFSWIKKSRCRSRKKIKERKSQSKNAY